MLLKQLLIYSFIFLLALTLFHDFFIEATFFLLLDIKYTLLYFLKLIKEGKSGLIIRFILFSMLFLHLYYYLILYLFNVNSLFELITTKIKI
jgi:hypothetical protein